MKSVNLRLPQSSAEIKGRVWLYLNSPSGPSCQVMGWRSPSVNHHVTCIVFSFDSLLWTAINIYEHVERRQGKALTSAANGSIPSITSDFYYVNYAALRRTKTCRFLLLRMPELHLQYISGHIPRWRNALRNVFLQNLAFQQPLLGSVSRATSLPTGDVIYLEFLVQAATKVKRITKLNQTPKWCSADSQLKKKTPSYSQFHSVCPYVHFFCTCLQVRLYALYIWRLIWSQAWFNVTEILRYVTVVSEVEIRGHGTDC